MKKISTPLSKKVLAKLEAGDTVLVSGAIYTARDQAHALIAAALKNGTRLPFDLAGQVIYFCGPTKTRPGSVIGSCGPTTSRRMDAFSPTLLKAGLSAMIGKGDRSPEVVRALKKYHAVYFLAYAGCGALISGYVRSSRVIAYPALGPEAIYRLEVCDLPLIVGADSAGRNLYAGMKL